MNYAEDRLDRRARSSENNTGGSGTRDQLACDLKCAHDVLISSSSSNTTKQSLIELRDAHELCGKTLRDSGQNRQAVYHFGMAWRISHLNCRPDKHMNCNTNDENYVDCNIVDEHEKAVGDYAQMCELSGFPEVGVLALLYYRAGGSLDHQAPSIDNTTQSSTNCCCGMTECGSSPCYIAFPHQSSVMNDILDALDTLSISSSDDREFPTASDILGQLSSYTKKSTTIKDPVSAMHTFLCERIKNVPPILQFWNDGSIVSTSNNTQNHQYRTLPPVTLLLLLKLLYSSPISNSFLQLACISMPYLAARFPPSSTEGRLLARNYKSHMAYYVFIRYLVLGERVKKHRKGKVIHHVAVWDVVFRLEECDQSRLGTSSLVNEKKEGNQDTTISSYCSKILRECSCKQNQEASMPIIMQQSTYPPIYVVGDSHVLSLAWQILCIDTSSGQKQRQFVPFPATGLKAFHTTTPRFFTHYNLHACLQRLPSSCRTIILSAGEIDCREGIGGLLLEGYDQDCSEAIEKTVVEYLRAITELAKQYKLQVLLMPVAPHAYRSEKNGKSLGRAKRRETMHIWNHILRRELIKEDGSSQQNKYNQIFLLDYEEHLRQNDCNSPVDYVLHPSYNADYTHVNSALVPLLQVAIEQSGCDFTLL